MGMDFGAALRAQDGNLAGHMMAMQDEQSGDMNITWEPSHAPAAQNPYDLAPVRAKLAVYDAEIDKMVAQTERLMVSDDATNATAVEMANQAKKIDAAIERVRKDLVLAPNEYVKSVNGLAKGFQGRLGTIVASLRGKVGAYAQRIEMERRKAEEAARKAQAELQAKIDAEAKAAHVEPVQIAAPALPKQQTIVRTEAGSATQRKVWKHEITDETQVPREYLMVDEAKVRQAVKQGVREIPGIRIYEHTEIAFRG
ncbi:hypothetical protein SAMN04488503_2214 [Humidesulfovibrio mexicanus]|uniref:Uncharacterized protein n=1 Tax=Humidesulfovibrio mexicanus TaxID=147047 RepID=A0A239AUF7_9BACT|nr:hypothetical protein [Humidesulfovibrio mexicanus]SNR98981.1 hypothetical protein SAMN04488503_2214 [Humidesulfovibrio mexicanus]